jgi:hypothetical protein
MIPIEYTRPWNRWFGWLTGAGDERHHPHPRWWNHFPPPWKNVEQVPLRPVIDRDRDALYKFIIKDAADHEVDLGEYTARMELRPYPGCSRTYDVLTTEDGRLTIKCKGRIEAFFSDEVTKGYTFPKAFYELFVIGPNGHRYRVAVGDILFGSE